MGRAANGSTVTFFVKRPRVGRRTFSVIKRTRHLDKTYSYVSIKTDDLNAINQQFKSGLLSYDDCNALFMQLKNHLQYEQDVRFGTSDSNIDNQSLLKKYWQDRYAHRGNKSPTSFIRSGER